VNLNQVSDLENGLKRMGTLCNGAQDAVDLYMKRQVSEPVTETGYATPSTGRIDLSRSTQVILNKVKPPNFQAYS
jgi:hypothetical protein